MQGWQEQFTIEKRQMAHRKATFENKISTN